MLSVLAKYVKKLSITMCSYLRQEITDHFKLDDSIKNNK